MRQMSAAEVLGSPVFVVHTLLRALLVVAAIITAGFLLFGCTAKGEELPISSVSPTAQAYATEQEAARAGIDAAIAASRSVEYGGAVVELDGRFYFTTPVTNNHGSHVEYRVEVPPGAVPVAIYHTHPEGTEFSDDDIQEAMRLGLRSYIGVAATGEVYVYSPPRSHADMTRAFALNRFSEDSSNAAQARPLRS